jgi:diguanylate cyclase (GGDEF)-like protein/PAS domain S-box-containing protein
MDVSSRSRTQMRDFARGQKVRFFNAAAEDLPLPPWLSEVTLGLSELGPTEAVAVVHADDQGTIVKDFLEMIERPGMISDIRGRFRIDGEWRWLTSSMLNLLDQPDVGGILSIWTVGDVAEADEPDLTARRVGGDDSVSWMQCQLDGLGLVLHVEGKSVEVAGRTSEEMIGQRLTDFIHADSSSASVPMWFSMIEEGPGATRSSRRCYVHPDGKELWVEAAYLNRLEDDGGFVLMFAYDITERRAQEEALLQRTEEVALLAAESQLLAEDLRRTANESHLLAEDLRLLADEVPAAVFRCDDEGLVTFHNSRWTELLGVGSDVRNLYEAVHPDDRSTLTVELADVVADAASTPRSFELRSAGGERVFAFRCRSIPDVEAGRRRIVGSIDDVTATVQLRAEARRDALTGVLNRAAIDQALTVALQEDTGDMLVLFIDLDEFKEVNDLYGHDAGDIVLVETAARLAAALRPDDLVGRYGGDEFVAVCRSVEPATAAAMVQRLGTALRTPVHFPGGSWLAGASIGAARRWPGDDLVSLIRRADQAMFEQKRRGRVER